MKSLRWRSTHDEVPDCYESVIICYRLGYETQWLVGAGYRHETGWTVESDDLEMQEDHPPVVCAWMDWPELPRCAVMRRTIHYRDSTEKGDPQ